MAKKLAVLAVVMGVVGASCSGGHGASSLLPGGAVAPRGAHASDVVTAPPGWAATATRGATVAGAADKGPLSGSTPLTVRVGLNLHNADQLASAVAAGQTFTPQQFQAQFGPSATDVQSVVSYLQSQGFRNVKPGAQLISADGTAAQAAKAFDTTLEAFSLGGSDVFVNVRPAFVPASLGRVISAVLGLSNASKMAVHPNVSARTPCRASPWQRRPANACRRSTRRTCKRSTTREAHRMVL